jgi:hypothetical protein
MGSYQREYLSQWEMLRLSDSKLVKDSVTEDECLPDLRSQKERGRRLGLRKGSRRRARRFQVNRVDIAERERRMSWHDCGIQVEWCNPLGCTIQRLS